MRPCKIRSYELRVIEICVGEIRPAEIRPAEIRWLGSVLFPPLIPNSGTLLEDLKVFEVSHSGILPLDALPKNGHTALGLTICYLESSRNASKRNSSCSEVAMHERKMG